MLVIITYDVSTESPEGRRRLRRVAKLCERTGQRVQKSVFECQVSQMQLEALEAKLVDTIDHAQDSLRIYRLSEPVELHVKEHGNVRAINFEDPLIC
ncbi:MAG: CRISPR-associated endonuclease Cas2 [Vampirovibrionales bacterium]|nr:CRISPR-associated endonuclease Cas2 [Vampirovibrionales bacterium]